MSKKKQEDPVYQDVILPPIPRPGPPGAEKLVLRILEPQIVSMPRSIGIGLRFTLESWFLTKEGEYAIQIEGCLAHLDDLGRLVWRTPRTTVRGYSTFRLVAVNENLYLAVLTLLARSPFHKVLVETARKDKRVVAEDLANFGLLEEEQGEEKPDESA